MRNKIITSFLTIMILGAGNSFAYKRGHAVPQTKTESHEKAHVTHEKDHAMTVHHSGHAVAAHHKGNIHHSTHHKSVAMHHKSKGHTTHHTGHGAVAHHTGHHHHNVHQKAAVIDEEVFNYPVQPTPVVAAVPVQKENETNADNNSKTDRDFKCYRAWKKDRKREKKEYLAEVKDAQGMPWAAERKRRKAYKKAWKADMIEHEYEGGALNADRPFWWY